MPNLFNPYPLHGVMLRNRIGVSPTHRHFFRDDGDLRFHTDFRSVYATLLDKWLLTDSQPVLGGSFAHLNFV